MYVCVLYSENLINFQHIIIRFLSRVWLCVQVCVCGVVVALIKFYHIKLTKQQTQKTLLSCRHTQTHIEIHDDEFT